jgi:hypothetical protein
MVERTRSAPPAARDEITSTSRILGQKETSQESRRADDYSLSAGGRRAEMPGHCFSNWHVANVTDRVFSLIFN